MFNSQTNFLKPYTVEEEPFYPGRPSHSEQLLQIISNNPLVVLHGPTASGKTSVLQAQIIPKLAQNGIKVLMTHISGDPLKDLKALLLNTTPDELSDYQLQRPLIQIVADNRPKDNLLVIIIDNIEDLLSFYNEEIVRKFFDSLSRVTHPLAKPDIPLAHVVLSIRTDFLPDLEKYSPRPLQLNIASTYHLPHINKAEIDLAFSSAQKETNLIFPNDLIDQIKIDAEKLRLRTIDIKILLEKIIFDHKENIQQGPGATQLITNTPSLDRYRSLGGAAKIIRGFLEAKIDDVINVIKAKSNYQVMPPRQISNYKIALRLILTLMVSQRDISTSVSRQEVNYHLLSANIGLNRNQVYRLLAGLQLKGLIRRIPASEPTYELSHSALAKVIWRWILPDAAKIKLIEGRDKIRRTLKDCYVNERLVNYDEICEITAFVGDIGLSRNGLLNFYHSSLLYDAYSNEWHNRIKNERIDPLPIIYQIINQKNFRDRQQLVKALYKIGKDAIHPLSEYLDDEYPQVRAAATAALTKLDPSNQWHPNLKKESFIQAGVFTIGANQGFFSDEGPEHKVTLPGFFIGKYPITNLDFQKFADDINIPFSFPLGMERHPVVNLTWYDAREYARWGSYRLPSEPEWEKAASQDSSSSQVKRRYPWGNTFEETKCNMRANKLNGTTRVGTYSIFNGDSASGCADMAGNVWEWTSSQYKPYPYHLDDGREDPSEIGSRVIRGGSFKSGATYVTCTVRQPFDSYSKREDVGFRCVLKLPDVDLW